MKTFLIVLFISVLGFGIFSTVLLYPNDKPTWNILFKIFFRPYLLVFGELGLQNYELKNDVTVFGTKQASRPSEIMVIVGMGLFLLFANVLLLNLLIANFSNIYEKMMTKAYQLWRFEEYQVLMEFQRKSILPVPFSILANLWSLVSYICRSKKSDEENDQSSQRLTENDRKIVDFERFCMMKLQSQGRLDISGSDRSLSNGDDLAVMLRRLELDSKERENKTFEVLNKQITQFGKRIEAIKEEVADRMDEPESKLNQQLADLTRVVLDLHHRILSGEINPPCNVL